MQTHIDAAKLITWMEEHGDATVDILWRAGLAHSRRAVSDAVAYAVNNGAIEAVSKAGAGRVSGRRTYRPTGHSLPVQKKFRPPAEFEPLLTVWGIPLEAPDLTGLMTRRCEMFDV